ncbi:MAG: L-rhamnose mutarotase [Flavobacteriaceae bacterium]
MKRHAFKMKLLPGFEEEYKKRHDAIWPELKQLLHEMGLRDYAIFFDPETHSLFAVQKQTSHATPQQIPHQDIVKKWWAFMADIMETHPNNAPIEFPLEEVFYME